MVKYGHAEGSQGSTLGMYIMVMSHHECHHTVYDKPFISMLRRHWTAFWLLDADIDSVIVACGPVDSVHHIV